MPPQITTAQRAVLDHLLDEGFETLGVVPTGPVDVPIDWMFPVLLFVHPADPRRLLIGVDTAHGWTLVALDHLAHRHCDHGVCAAVFDQREHEIAEIPADGALFAIRTVETTWSDGPLSYLVHIDDHLSAEAAGWNGILTDHGEYGNADTS